MIKIMYPTFIVPLLCSTWILFIFLATALSALKAPSTAPGRVGTQSSFSLLLLPAFSFHVGSTISSVPTILGSLMLHRVSELFLLFLLLQKLRRTRLRALKTPEKS